MKKYIFAAAVTAALLFTAGCRTDRYYQHRAVERAREFLLEEARSELSAKQFAVIRYNQPVLLSSKVIGTGAWGKTDTERRQICITWQVPDSEKLYMVFGVSTGRMDDWYPNRVIRKRFDNRSTAIDNAIRTARAYAVNNLQGQLTPTQLNQVRFQRPWLLKTSFPLSFDPYGKATPEELAKARKAADGLVQYSLVWRDNRDPAADRVVCCGLADEMLKGWGINFAGMIPAAEVEKATVSVIRAPADIEKPLTAGETAAASQEKK